MSCRYQRQLLWTEVLVHIRQKRFWSYQNASITCPVSRNLRQNLNWYERDFISNSFQFKFSNFISYHSLFLNLSMISWCTLNFVFFLQIELAANTGVFLTREQICSIKLKSSQASMYREILKNMIPEDILKHPGLSVTGGKGCAKLPLKITSVAEGIKRLNCLNFSITFVTSNLKIYYVFMFQPMPKLLEKRQKCPSTWKDALKIFSMKVRGRRWSKLEPYNLACLREVSIVVCKNKFIKINYEIPFWLFETFAMPGLL